MLLKVGFKCPFCGEMVEWIYDVETNQTHRSATGCPGGCTAIHETEIDEVSKDEARQLIDNQLYYVNHLELGEDGS